MPKTLHHYIVYNVNIKPVWPSVVHVFAHQSTLFTEQTLQYEEQSIFLTFNPMP